MSVDPRLPITVGALGALLVAASAGWWQASWNDGLAGAGAATLSGVQGTAGLAAVLPAAALAALLATLTLRRTGRRIMGVVAALLGVGMVVVGLIPPTPSREVVAQSEHTASLAADVAVHVTFAPAVFAGLGAVVLAAAVWMVVSPPQPRRARRENGAAVEDPLSSWKAMDAGVDPTRDEVRPGHSEQEHA